ncbi:MARCKS-related protein 1-B [Salmo salar]|uniref:MARCKS-related protein 1-B n=1 Tax=Salmo salar TaxID=8030 RepID=A0A1S3M635_SALSA|nr:MARCKS-related protein 1-B [Salmo salar]|eukprot:XP_013998637.1 PREDICTED: MARCKS-related protein-like [Salmo salar]
MGSQASKGEVVVEAKAAAADAVTVKTNGQENGHVKSNGDVSATETAATNGSTDAAKEPEAGAGGDAIEPAPAADKEAAKPEGEAAAKDIPKKKKKFSLKKSFNFKLKLKKTKKEEVVKEEEAAAAPAEEKPAENGAAVASEEKKEEVVKEEAAAPATDAPKAEEVQAKAEEVKEAPKEEVKVEVKEAAAAAPAPEPTKPTEETSSTPTAAAPSQQKAE